MKKTLKILTFIFCITTLNYSYSQFNPIEIIDKVAGTLLPEVVNGVKSIKESNKKAEKNEQAEKLEENFKAEQEKAINEARSLLISEISSDIEYLETISLVQNQIARISNDVGRLSMFKDEGFIDMLLKKESVTIKNGLVRKFQNSLEQVNTNNSELRSIRNQINSSNISADANAVVKIGAIVSKLEEINSEYNDCSKLSTSNDDETKVNECISSIRSVSNDIARLEDLVEDLNIETTSMLVSYMKNFKKIRSSYSINDSK